MADEVTAPAEGHSGANVPADPASSRATAVGAMRDELAARREKLRLVLLVVAAVVVLALDQTSKAWIRAHLPQGDVIPVWPGVMHLSHVLNHGAAWNMLEGQRWVLVAITLVVLVGAGTMARQFARRGTLPSLALGLIVGGALGNLVDRVLTGTVTDMIDMDTSWEWLRRFPVFNLADSALTLGVTLMLVFFFFGDRSEAAPQS